MKTRVSIKRKAKNVYESVTHNTTKSDCLGIDGAVKRQIHTTINKWLLRFPGLNIDVMRDDIARELSNNLVNEKYCKMDYVSGYCERIERQESFIKELKSTFNKIKRYIDGI